MVAVKQQVLNFVEDNYMTHRPIEDLDQDRPLLEQGILDSTGVLELIAWIEETFEFKIADDEITLENLGSVNLIAEFILRRAKEQTGVELE